MQDDEVQEIIADLRHRPDDTHTISTEHLTREQAKAELEDFLKHEHLSGLKFSMAEPQVGSRTPDKPLKTPDREALLRVLRWGVKADRIPLEKVLQLSMDPEGEETIQVYHGLLMDQRDETNRERRAVRRAARAQVDEAVGQSLEAPIEVGDFMNLVVRELEGLIVRLRKVVDANPPVIDHTLDESLYFAAKEA